MRPAIRSVVVLGWLMLMGTGVAVSAMSGTTNAAASCYYVDGVLYCPCEAEADDCAPPECILIDDEWYCPTD